MSAEARVAVIGAGVAGATSAYRLRQAAVAMHYMEDPIAGTRVPKHTAEVGKRYAAQQRGSIAPVDYGDQERRQRDPGNEVQGGRWEADNLKHGREECEQPSGLRRWSHDVKSTGGGRSSLMPGNFPLRPTLDQTCGFLWQC